MMWTLKVSTERQGKRLNSNNKNPETENSQNENIEVEEKVVKRPGRPRRKTTNDKPAAVKRTQTRGAKKKEDAPLGKGLKIIPLGGLEQIGMNITAFEYDDSIVVVDCGLSFPEDEMLGIDLVIPDITYLKENIDKVKGFVITHGHEDHIGALPYVLKEINVPVYATKLTMGLIENKLKEHVLPKPVKRKVVKYGQSINLGCFRIEFIRTNHSISDAAALAIFSPAGIVVHTGDFKVDYTPVFGDAIDLQRFAEIGKKGVLALMCDSTNAERKGFTMSERTVGRTFDNIFAEHRNTRIIIATFASNIFRIKHIVETCKQYGRKIIVFGRSMENAIELASNNGLIEDKSIFIDAYQAKSLKRNEVCILCTGTQGEPLAALSRIANGVHKQISLLNDDLVIFSSSAIPGNANSINKIINKLYLKGVRVFTNTEFSDIHTSGHAKEEELKWMLRIIKPAYFMPMHGEYRMLKKHAEIAKMCDVENSLICENGNVVKMLNGKVYKDGNVISGDVYVDGSRVGDVGSVVIKDRKLMSHDGILITILNINTLTRKLLIKPNVTARGFVTINENIELINKIENKISDITNNYLAKSIYSYTDLKNQIILEVLPYINELTGRRPIILPVIMEVNQSIY